VDVDAWPTEPLRRSPARPLLRAWWLPENVTPSGADLGVQGLVGGEVPVPLPDEAVAVEGLQAEDHEVEVRPGVKEVRHCLVLRLRHRPGQPVLARMAGLVPAGSEQRFYGGGRATVLFWFAGDVNLKPKSDDLAAARLRLISLTAFKKQAAGLGCHLEVNDLSAPDPIDARPQTPLELK
jgi:hypothetical protein